MYGIIRQVIGNGGYKLNDMQQKIKRMYVLGDLTAEQTDELLSLALAGAQADAERPETIEMIRSLASRVDAIEAKLGMGEAGEAYPAWKPWDGVSDNYQPGAIVSHNAKLWQSVYEGQNVWEPGVVGEGFWAEYEEA